MKSVPPTMAICHAGKSAKMKVTTFFTALMVSFSFNLCAQQIDFSGIGQFKIGSNLNELSNKLHNYDKTTFDKIHYFMKGEEVFLMAWTYENSLTVRGLGTQSPLFVLSNGLKVGSAIADIKALYPNAKIGISPETGEEYITIEGLSVQLGGRKRVIIFMVKAENHQKLGIYEGDGVTGGTSNFSNNGTISRIEVYNWN